MITAEEYFAAKLEHETDASDLHTALANGERITVVDVRSAEAWAQGRVLGAIHLPWRDIVTRADEVIPRDIAVVVYCWSPGCNAGAKAALEFARLGYPVKEMIGGFEYWAREGYAIADADGVHHRPIDPLTGIPRVRSRA